MGPETLFVLNLYRTKIKENEKKSYIGSNMRFTFRYILI